MDDKLLLEMLTKKAGGRKKIEQEFVSHRLADAMKSSKTIGQILDKAETEGWKDQLLGVKFTALFAQGIKEKSTSGTISIASRPTKKKSSGRLTAADKEKMVAGIMEFLKNNPWSKKGDIAKAVGFTPAQVAVQMQGLRESKLIKSKGKLSQTVWSTNILTLSKKGKKSKSPA